MNCERCAPDRAAFKLAGNEKLRIERELPETKDRAQMVRDVLRSLVQPVVTPVASPAVAK
jgi:transcription-repair coupling factor (superfamily II helicase)